jgi:hypothetical protein
VRVAVRGQGGAGLAGRAWVAALVGLGLLVFTWPFVRTPPLGLLGSYLHLLGAWAVMVLAIAATARALGRGGADA